MIDNELNMGRRRSLRLAGYDYSSAGMYFVTVCTDGKVNLFGEIHSGEMRLSAAGDAVASAWMAIPERFAAVQLDAFVVMPNHFHGVIFIWGGGGSGAGSASTRFSSKDAGEGAVGIARAKSSSKDADEGAASSARTKSKSKDAGEGAVGIARAKFSLKDAGEGAASSARTKIQFTDARTKSPNLGTIMRAFKSISAIRINEILGRKGRPVWHRNYFEHIVRRGKDLEEIRRYIAQNPGRWGQDEENPENT